MKLGTQVYSRPTKDQKCIQIRYNPDDHMNCALNFTGFAYVDHKYSLIKNCLAFNWLVVTDNDLIAHDDYIAAIRPGTTIILVYQAPKKAYTLLQRISNVAFNGCGASKKRLQKAKTKLQAAGIKVKIFTSEKTCLNYLSRIGA